MRKKLHDNRAFTLMEMLIVVAIIAVLVAIGITVFTSTLEKAREAVDLANIRSAYAEVMTSTMTGGDCSAMTLGLMQQKEGWVTESAESSLNTISNGHVEGAPANGNTTVLIEWVEGDQCVRIVFDGSGSGSGTSGNPAMTDSDLRRAVMKSVASGLNRSYAELIPANQLKEAKKNLHHDEYNIGDDHILVNELPVSTMNLTKYGPYWENGKAVTWLSFLEQTGVDSEMLKEVAEEPASYVYFDDDFNPVAVSYYVDKSTSNAYRYVFLDDGTTVEMAAMPWDRQHAGYYKDYALKVGTEIKD